MYIQQAQINDYSTGASYNYTDHSGSWQSIKTIAGNSTVKNTILQTPRAASLSIAQKFKNLSPTTKIGIYAGGGAAAALLFFALMFTCIRQKRKGRAERDAYNALIEKQRTDAYNDQVQLREKGLGGWDKGAFEHQGEDALGGWVGKNGDMPKSPSSPGFAGSPTSPNFSRPAEQPFLPGFTHEDIPSPAPVRINSPVGSGPRSPIVVSPQAMSPHTAAWGGDGGNGEYQGPFSNNSQGSLNRQPSFPFSNRSSPAPTLQQPQMPPQQRFNTGGGGGYARF